MVKNIIISILAAALTVDKLSQIIALTVADQVALWITFAWVLIIFCIFLEDKAEKWRKRRNRVQHIREILSKLCQEVNHG